MGSHQAASRTLLEESAATVLVPSYHTCGGTICHDWHLKRHVGFVSRRKHLARTIIGYCQLRRSHLSRPFNYDKPGSASVSDAKSLSAVGCVWENLVRLKPKLFGTNSPSCQNPHIIQVPDHSPTRERFSLCSSIGMAGVLGEIIPLFHSRTWFWVEQ